MGALVHTTTPAGLVGDGLGIVFASGSLVGGGGVYSQSSVAAKSLSLMHTRAVQIGGLGGLGFSPCPCFCGNFGKLWGPIARLSRQPIRRSVRSFRKLEFRSQLRTDDDSEKMNSEGLESESFDDRISPSPSPSPRADAPSDGEGRGSRGQQPQPQPKIAYRLVTALASVAVGALVVLSLSVAYDGYDADLVKAQDLDLPFVEPEVVTSSSPRMISLAKHLQSVGARMYGAFWCSHCYEQKQMLGREAMKYVDYVECYPEGYKKGVPIAKPCDEANIQGFPTWIIKGQILSGEQELDDLAKVSGFDKSQFE
ncbi:unnamed protein product [Calypogeia fissa]